MCDMCGFETARHLHSACASWDRPVSSPPCPPCRHPEGGRWRGSAQHRGLAADGVNNKSTAGASKHTFLISPDKHRGAPDLWPHFTGH